MSARDSLIYDKLYGRNKTFILVTDEETGQEYYRREEFDSKRPASENDTQGTRGDDSETGEGAGPHKGS